MNNSAQLGVLVRWFSALELGALRDKDFSDPQINSIGNQP